LIRGAESWWWLTAKGGGEMHTGPAFSFGPRIPEGNVGLGERGYANQQCTRLLHCKWGWLGARGGYGVGVGDGVRK
jgi:hypothetical protein